MQKRSKRERILIVLSYICQSCPSVLTEYIFIVFACMKLSSMWRVTNVCIKYFILMVTLDMSKLVCY